MCGINGIFAYGTAAPAVSAAELLATREHMSKRGPDGAGEWYQEQRRVALGHRRLSIIDLDERASQPMVSDDGQLAITFNGEIYNYGDIRRELETEGVAFRTQSDTEVLLQLYAQRGEAMVDALRGMYAFVIWDSRRGALFLARDPYGIKPLYTADDGWTFRFASQVKALLAGGAVSRDPEPAGLIGFHLFGNVPEPFTLYRDIRALPAGHVQWVDHLGPREPRPFARLADELARGARAPASASERQAHIAEAVCDSVRAHMVADVNVGIFLSAGIDSCALLGTMRDHTSADIQALTLGFEEYRGSEDDEVPFAAEAAQQYGARHVVKRTARPEFESDLPAILEAMDQPSIDGVNTWFVAKAAKDAGLKVAISGLGGDELFAGYPSFRNIPRWRRRFGFLASVPGAGRLARSAMALLPQLTHHKPKAAGVLEFAGSLPGAYLLQRGLFLPHELSRLMDAELVREGLRRLNPLRLLQDQLDPDPGSDVGRVCVLESANYMRNQLLRDADWAGMAHGIEIRVPLVDWSLLRAVSACLTALRPGEGKVALANVPRKPLPTGIVRRAKTGFSVPTGAWMNAVTANDENVATKGAASRRWSKVVLEHTDPALRHTSRPRKVLVLATEAFGGEGGIAQYNRDFLAALAEIPGFSIDVLPRLQRDREALVPIGVTQHPPSFNKYAYGAGAVSHAMRSRPDIIVNAHLLHSPLSQRIAELAGAPMVSILHGTEVWDEIAPGLLRSLMKSRVLAFASDDTRRRVSAQAPNMSSASVVTYNTVGEQFQVGDRVGAKRAFDVEGKLVIATVGRLDARAGLDGNPGYKGHDRVIRALRGLRGFDRPVIYLVGGEGEDLNRLERVAADEGVADRVRFLGRVPDADLPNFYRAADIFAMPSTGEGFGIVYLQAMACGTPAIGLNIGGAAEALENLGVVAPLEHFDAEFSEAVARAARFSDDDRQGLSHKVQQKFGRKAFAARIRGLMDLLPPADEAVAA